MLTVDNTLYLIDYPMVDTNIEYNAMDLIGNGHLVIMPERYSSIIDEARQDFGTPMDIVFETYDLNAIQKYYSLDYKPKFVGKDINGYMFEAGNTTLSIPQSRISQFMDCVKNERMVYHARRIAGWVDDGDIFSYLHGAILEERGLRIRSTGTYKLSYNQLVGVASKLRKQNILKFYNHEAPSIYIAFQKIS